MTEQYNPIINSGDDLIPVPHVLSQDRFDVVDLMMLLGLPLEKVYQGEYARAYLNRSFSTYDPFSSNGFMLSAEADTDVGKLLIGFDTLGNIVRSVLGNVLISPEEAMAVWVASSK